MIKIIPPIMACAIIATTATAQENILDDALQSCIEIVFRDRSEGKGHSSDAYRAGTNIIERNFSYDSEADTVECRLVGLQHIRDNIVISWPLGAELVPSWIERMPYMEAFEILEDETIIGCGMVDVMARPFTGELRNNPYRSTPDATAPLEVTITKPGVFCNTSD